MNPLLRLLVVPLTFAMLVAAPAHAKNVKDEAARYYEQGTQAFRSGEFARAAELYARSLDLVKHANTLFNLADSQARAGQHVQAARSFRRLLDGFAPPAPAGDFRAEVEALLIEQEKRVGRLRITVDVAGASLTVDNDAVGNSPLAFAWHVAPGEHEVSATKPGFIPKTQRVAVAPGEIAYVRLVLRGETDMPGAGLATGPEGARPGGEDPAKNGKTANGLDTKTAVGIGGLALTAIAAGIGLGFGLDALSKQDDADELRDRSVEQLGKDGCASSASGICADVRDKRDAANRSADISTISFVAAGVLGTATVVTWLVWPKSEHKTSATADVAVVPTSHGAMAVAVGTF